MRKENQELGTGSIGRLMLRLALPAVVGQIINLLYNVVDRIYIGHIPEVGADALTGVGLFSPILMLITAFAMLPSAGGSPRAAIAMGRGDREEAERIMSNCFTFLLLMAVVLTLLFYGAAPTLLRLFGASGDTIPYALDYGRIYILGSVFVLIVMGMNPFITTQGFARVSMLTTVIGALLNILLDPIFIFALGLGVKGAAIATVLSQGVSALWILRFLTGERTQLRLSREKLGFQREVLLPCLALGVSSFVMLSTESILSISFTSSLARFGGDLAVGAMTVMASINQLLSMPLTGICQGGQPIISFNYGAGRLDRVKRAFLCQFGACVAYTTLFWIFLRLFPQFFAGIFTDDAALVAYTAGAMKIFLACAFSIGFQISCQQAFMALGQAKISLFMACLRKLILLIPLIYLLPVLLEDKVFAVFLAEPIADVIAAAVTTGAFFLYFRKLVRTQERG